MARRGGGRAQASRRHVWIAIGGLALLGWLASAVSSSKKDAPTDEHSATVRNAPSTDATRYTVAPSSLETGSDVLWISTNGTDLALTDGRQLITIGSDGGKPAKLLNAEPDEPFHEVALGVRSLYWSQGGCSRWSFTTKIGRAEGSAAKIVVDNASSCVETMTVDNDALYWMEQARGVVLRALDKSGKPKELWSDGTILWASDLAVRGQQAFFIAQGKDEDRVLQVDLSTRAVTTLAIEPKEVRHLAVTESGVCFWSTCPYNQSCTLKTSAGRPGIELAHAAASLALHAGYLWWFDTDADPDVLMRVPVDGGTPERVATSPDDGSILLTFVGTDAVWSTKNHLWRLSTTTLTGERGRR